MTIIITKTKLALAILAVALLAPAAALATNVFADVDDGAFYAAPVEWAFNNNITTGKTATSFAPLDDVTRGESVTFLKRYDDNIVQPAIAALSDNNPTVTVMHYTGSNTDSTVNDSWEKMRDLGSFTKATASSDMLIAATGNGLVNGVFCQWQLRVDGVTDAGNSGTIYSPADGASAVQYATGSYFTQGWFEGLAAGSHTVELWIRGSATACENNDGNFGHDVFATEFKA
jgi:S-layer homology domain